MVGERDFGGRIRNKPKHHVCWMLSDDQYELNIDPEKHLT